jgi:hypothetical protein
MFGALQNELNIVYLQGKTPGDIQKQLDQLYQPYVIFGAYAIGNTHVLVIGTNEKVLIKKKV